MRTPASEKIKLASEFEDLFAKQIENTNAAYVIPFPVAKRPRTPDLVSPQALDAKAESQWFPQYDKVFAEGSKFFVFVDFNF